MNFDGTTGPYAQYTNARAKSVLRKYGKTVEVDEINTAEKNEPSIVARYVIALATAFNKFYHECTILQAEEKEKESEVFYASIQTVQRR